MNIDQMRLFILDNYPNATQKFRAKVAKEMPTNQIVAIYYSILERNKRKKEKADNSSKEEKKEEYHQMDIWEYLCNTPSNS